MTVLLVLGTFLVFIVLDYALNRRKAIHTVSAEAHSAFSRFGADYVDGFLVPQSVSYHSGHSWLVRERQNVVRVGADEFAEARAVGPAGAESDFLLPRRPEDGNGLPDGRGNHGDQHRSNREPHAAAPGSLRQRLAGQRARSRRGKHHTQPDSADAGW